MDINQPLEHARDYASEIKADKKQLQQIAGALDPHLPTRSDRRARKVVESFTKEIVQAKQPDTFKIEEFYQKKCLHKIKDSSTRLALFKLLDKQNSGVGSYLTGLEYAWLAQGGGKRPEQKQELIASADNALAQAAQRGLHTAKLALLRDAVVQNPSQALKELQQLMEAGELTAINRAEAEKLVKQARDAQTYLKDIQKDPLMAQNFLEQMLRNPHLPNTERELYGKLIKYAQSLIRDKHI